MVDGYGLVLALQGVMFLLIGATDRRPIHALFVLAAGAGLVLSYRASNVRPRVMRTVLIITAVVVLIALSTGPSGEGFADYSTPLLQGLLVFLGPFVIVRRILQHKVVSTQTILGAICAYVYIGFTFVFIYAILATQGGEPLFTQDAAVTPANLNYFSFVTLTTLGYGDLTLADDVSRQFAVLEAMIGQIYLVTLIARLVSLYGNRRSTDPASPQTD